MKKVVHVFGSQRLATSRNELYKIIDKIQESGNSLVLIDFETLPTNSNELLNILKQEEGLESDLHKYFDSQNNVGNQLLISPSVEEVDKKENEVKVHFDLDSWDFDRYKSKGEYIVSEKHNISDDTIETVMVGFLEGGSFGFYRLNNTGPLWEQKPKGIPVSVWSANLLIDGHKVILEDSEDFTPYELTLEKLIKGLKLNAEMYPKDPHPEEGDAITFNRIIQLSLHDRIIYG